MRGVRVAVTRLLNEPGTFSLICETAQGEKSASCRSTELAESRETTHLVEDHAADSFDGDRALKLGGRSLSDE